MDLSVDLSAALDTIATAGPALTGAARTAPEAPVPWCPGWTVDDVVRHTGLVHTWAAALIEGGGSPPGTFPSAPDGLAGAALADWADERRQALLAVLASADPDRPAWAFGPPVPARFWWRRQAHETAVHAWDATAAAGEAWTIPGDVAADGIDELLGSFLSRRWAAKEPAWASGRTVHLHRTDGHLHRTDSDLHRTDGDLHRTDGDLHRTDGDGEWLLTIGAEPVIERSHGKGDLAVRAPAATLLLWALNRVPDDAPDVELFGDTDLAASWHTHVRF